MSQNNPQNRMAWFAELAGKAENLLNNLDEQTGAALRNHKVAKTNGRPNRHDACIPQDIQPQRRPSSLSPKRRSPDSKEGRDHSKPPWKAPNHIPRSLYRKPVVLVGQTGSKSPSPTRRNSGLNNLSNVMVIGCEESNGLHKIHRRNSLPAELENKHENVSFKMQHLQVENAILKSEFTAVNKHLANMLERVKKTEEDLTKAYGKVDSLEALNEKVSIEKETLERYITELKMKVNEAATLEKNKETQFKQKLEEEIHMLKETKNELENRIIILEMKKAEEATAYMKLEKELRHQQSTNQELQNSLDKSVTECHRLEREWNEYKVRVKNMLAAKDGQIKSFQEGINLTEDTKMLMEQLESLREEREDLELQISRLRSECSDMRTSIQQLETRSSSAERMISVLREAMREERAAKNNVESECFTLRKEIKAIQQETTETIANLRSALHEKETECTQLRESTSQTIDNTPSSSLNVADYTTKEDNDKIDYLTQTLVQRQTKIDMLLADNNMLKIQLEKMESKYRNELANLRMNNNHSIVNVDDSTRLRNKGVKYIPESVLESLSLRLGVFIRRNPIFRLFIIFYMHFSAAKNFFLDLATYVKRYVMQGDIYLCSQIHTEDSIGLHLWVMTVLFTSTPDIIPKRAT